MVSDQSINQYEFSKNMIKLYWSYMDAQNSLLQVGQYEEANDWLSKMNSTISNLGGPQAWNETKYPICVQSMMYTVQLLETFGVGPKTNLFGFMIEDPIVKNYTKYSKFSNAKHDTQAIFYSETGRLLIYILQAIQSCSTNTIISCNDNSMIRSALKTTKNLDKQMNLTYKELEGTLKMTYQIMLGMIDLAERIRPHGLECYAQRNCSVRKTVLSDNANKIMTGPFRNATHTQKQFSKEKKAGFTFNFILPSEIYGHILLFLDRFEDAKEMFEETLLNYSFGRTISLLGLARAHGMLGDTKKATFFYQYLRDQYHEAAKDNPVVKEAETWLTETKMAEWFWPYFSPEYTKLIQDKGE